jgi:hypothetical protein
VRPILISVGAGLILLAAGSMALFVMAPLGLLLLAGFVIIVGARMRRWATVILSTVLAVIILVIGVIYWNAWGQAFDYVDANKSVPTDLQALELACRALGLAALLALTGMSIYLLVSRPRNVDGATGTSAVVNR